MTVVSLLTLPLRDGAGDELTRRFAELGIFEHARESGGFVRGRLLTPLAGRGDVVVLAEWESAAAYEAWLGNPVREELGAGLQELLLDDVAAGELYEDAT
jgi:heme-degrading monooxygenase HmoA